MSRSCRSVVREIRPLAPPLALLLSDCGLPPTDPPHSGGVEEACASGLITSPPRLAEFLHARLWTLGATSAYAAAGVCARAANRTVPDSLWRSIESEIDARILSPTARSVSRTQGSALLQLALQAAPDALLLSLDRATHTPHHAVAIGAVSASAGAIPQEAAALAAQASVAGPLHAGRALLALSDEQLAGIAGGLDDAINLLSMEAGRSALRSVSDFPARIAPGLAFLAEEHARREGRSYAS